MSGGSAFLDIIQVFVFFLSLWFGGRLFRQFGLSAIIPEILIGIVFHEVHWLPFMEKHNPWLLAGNIGVGLMIAESGSHINFVKAQQLGVSAMVVSLVGSISTVFVSWGMFKLMNSHAGWHECFAVGATLAPTSVGIALKLLSDASMLNSDTGQLIVLAAFIDDIFSLLLLALLQATDPAHHTDNPAAAICVPIVASIGLLAGAAFVAKNYAPSMLNWFLALRIFEDEPGKTLQKRDEIILGLFFVLLLGLTVVANMWGAWLVGAFATGLLFCEVSKSHLLWRHQVKRIANWFVRLFFACGVGFLIPVGEMMTPTAFGKGTALCIVGAVFTKLAGGMHLGRQGVAIGVAMVCRGEFAFYVADAAGFSKETFAQVVWALVLTIVFGPIVGGAVFEWFNSSKPTIEIDHLVILVQSRHKYNAQFWIVDVLRGLQLDIIDSKQETDGETDLCRFIVTANGQVQLDAKKMHQIEHDITAALDDPQTEVIMSEIKNYQKEYLLEHVDMVHDENYGLEIKIIAHSCLTSFNEIFEAVERLGFEVVTGDVKDHFGMLLETFTLRPGEDNVTNSDWNSSLVLQDLRHAAKMTFRELGISCSVLAKPKLIEAEGEKNDQEKMVKILKSLHVEEHANNAGDGTGMVVRRKTLRRTNRGFVISFSFEKSREHSVMQRFHNLLRELTITIHKEHLRTKNKKTTRGDTKLFFEGKVFTSDHRDLGFGESISNREASVQKKIEDMLETSDLEGHLVVKGYTQRGPTNTTQMEGEDSTSFTLHLAPQRSLSMPSADDIRDSMLKHMRASQVAREGPLVKSPYRHKSSKKPQSASTSSDSWEARHRDVSKPGLDTRATLGLPQFESLKTKNVSLASQPTGMISAMDSGMPTARHTTRKTKAKRHDGETLQWKDRPDSAVSRLEPHSEESVSSGLEPLDKFSSELEPAQCESSDDSMDTAAKKLREKRRGDNKKEK